MQFFMTIFEKIHHTSLGEVRIYKEGAFWVAYEQSAYYFAMLKGYKPTKKFVKCIGKIPCMPSSRISMGFILAGVASGKSPYARVPDKFGILTVFVWHKIFFGAKNIF
jgi:hypothetical protein